MRRLRQVLIAVLALWFAHVVVSLGGLVFWSYQGFGSGFILRAHGLHATVSIVPQRFELNVPLVAYYNTDRPPYGFRLQSWDHGRFGSFQLTEVIVEYEDGATVRFAPARVSDREIENAVTRLANFRLTIVGLLTTEHDTVQFRESMDFKAKSELQIKGWMLVAGEA
jgi:hypothetical protein